ncbi:MAG TPA: glucose-6-phosphate isomerase family protein [Candidatus Acidoferrales bacterium]
MASGNWPQGVRIDPVTGALAPETGHYTKRLSELRHIFHDAPALERAVAQQADPVVYDVAEYRQPDSDLYFGTTTIFPGTVGDEYYMTRGHFHERPDAAEIYSALHGTGVLLLESRTGENKIVEMTPGVTAFIPPEWAHRTMNVGRDNFVFLWACSPTAGHDYSQILKKGMRQLLLQRDGRPELVPNPNWS